MIKLITTAMRSRLKDGEGVARLNLGEGDKVETQKDLQDMWYTCLSVTSDYAIPVVGTKNVDGVFTASIKRQAEQICNEDWEDNTFLISYGLGLVPVNDTYPQYDLGKQESTIGKFVKGDRTFHPSKWWEFLTKEVSEHSITNIVVDAIENKDKVILSVNYATHNLVSNDLDNLIDLANSDDSDFDIGDVHRTLRIVGNEDSLETSVAEELLDCLMPINADEVNRIVPGGRMHVLRRIAFLTSQVVDDKPSLASDDYKAIDLALHADKIYNFDVGSSQPNKLANAKKKIDDDEVMNLIEIKYGKLGYGKPIRITRLMRADGLSVTSERVQELMFPGSTTKTKTGTDSKDVSESKPKAVTNKKTTKKKTTKAAQSAAA